MEESDYMAVLQEADMMTPDEQFRTLHAGWGKLIDAIQKLDLERAHYITGGLIFGLRVFRTTLEAAKAISPTRGEA